MATSNSFKDFMGAGVSSAVGTASLAARVGAAAFALGLSFSMPEPARAMPQRTAVEVDIGTVGEAHELIAVYAAAAVRSGLDPMEFSLFALVDHELNELDPEKVSLPASSARSPKGDVQIPTRELRRWVDMLLLHGEEAGAADAVQAYRAANALEKGKRRRPITEEVLRHVAALRDDAEVDSVVLAREALRIKAAFAAKGQDYGGLAGLYVASAFGLERGMDFAKAMKAAPGKPAHEVLKVPFATLKEYGIEGKPPTVGELATAIVEKADEYRSGVTKAIEKSSAELVGEGPRFG